MEVRPGYKQTEVGVIPEDWNVSPLGPYGFTYGGLTGKSKHHFGRGSALYVTFLDVMNHVVIDGTNVESVQVAQGESQNAVRLGDLLFTGSSETPEEVAMCSLVVVDQERLYLNSFCFGLRINLAPEVDGLFLTYVMRSGVGRKSIASLAQGSTRYNISKRALLAAPLPLPPLLEQRAIATALSDVDALLGGLDRLIAKKRDLKQAAMQQLLTGQTRLPGLSGEWEVKRLGDVVDTDPEALSSDTRPEFTFKYIALEDVDRGVLRGYSDQRFATAPSRARRKLRLDDVLVSTVRPNLQSHLLFRAEGSHWVCSTGFCVVRCHANVTHPGYVFYHLFGHPVSRQIEALLTGSNYPAINSGDVRALEIPLPDHGEQTAIAAALSDMDAELAALEARRDKTRDLKQAMMQELLTGKTRLVPTGAAHA